MKIKPWDNSGMKYIGYCCVCFKEEYNNDMSNYMTRIVCYRSWMIMLVIFLFNKQRAGSWKISEYKLWDSFYYSKYVYLIENFKTESLIQVPNILISYWVYAAGMNMPIFYLKQHKYNESEGQNLEQLFTVLHQLCIDSVTFKAASSNKGNESCH